MKKKRIIITIASVLIVASIGTFFALKPSPTSINQVETETQVEATGSKCTYTVGCSCSRFKPKTNGNEWEKLYCKRCGHHKNTTKINHKI